MPLWFVLMTMGLAALAAGSIRSSVAFAVLLMNWCACALFYRLTGDEFNSLANGVFDLVAGCAILALPFSEFRAGNRMQVVLAASYLGSIGWHGWFLSLPATDETRYTYWYAMHYIAWSQVWTALFWTGMEIAQMAGRNRYPWRVLLVRRTVPSSMDRSR